VPFLTFFALNGTKFIRIVDCYLSKLESLTAKGMQKVCAEVSFIKKIL